MDFYKKRVLVAGAGISGLAAVRLLMAQKAEVFLTDRQPKDKLAGVSELGLDDSYLILGREPDISEIKPELVVLSPGVSPQVSYIAEASRKGIPLWSEVELALRNSRAVTVGITGSNGKTTAATLAGKLAKATGRDTIIAGNIGLALSGEAGHLDENGIIVAELSSFQLEFIDKLRVHIAVMLNITPDHLDRHGTMENYAAAKARIFNNQTNEDLAVLNWDDPLVRSFAGKTKARVIYFSVNERLDQGIFLCGENIVRQNGGFAETVIGRRELLLKGNHNLQNVMAATAVALELGLKLEKIRELLRGFAPVKHRQEIVGRFNDILYINDSKGTNPDSSIKALQSYEEPIVLIAGGRNKGLDMTGYMHEAGKRVKSLVLVGEAAGEMEKAALQAGITRIIRTETFEDCVQKAIAEAVSGDVVLLSPACTSWDMFKSYEERGELFGRLVRKHYSEPECF